MLKKVYMLLGFALGGLFVWSYLTKARDALAREERMNQKLAPLAAHAQRELELKSAIDGVDYTSDEYWEQELAQYQDTYDKWEQGIFDDE